MTDKTQPEALRLSERISDMMCAAEEDARAIAEAADELVRQHTRIAELEAELEAVGAGGVQALSQKKATPASVDKAQAAINSGAGGVQALSASPEAIAKLRHLYQNMVNGAVRDTASATRIAEGLLAPAIEALERAAPKAAPLQQEWRLVLPGGKHTDEWESARVGDYNRGWNDYRKAAIAALNSVVWPARASGNWVAASTWLRNNYQDYPNITSLCDAMLEAAPQQEAQEPALFVSAKQLAALTDPDDPDGEHGRYLPVRKTTKGLFTQALYTAPQPAPAPLSDDTKDAARWRWLSEHIGVAWNEGKFTSLVRIVSDKNRTALNASIDRMMAGDWSDAALAAQKGTP